MENNKNTDNDIKFRPDYKWPKDGSERKCPKCDNPLELQNNSPAYYGKPWWCPVCQWQYSEEDL